VTPHTIVRILVAFAVAGVATAAFATAQRTFVASYGIPANTAFNCSLAKPCRAFSDAIGVTAANGEVIVLDSAGYGPVTITQSVSIISPPGVYAGVSVLAGDGITINGAGVVVTLKGHTVNGQGGNDGIIFQQGTRVTIDGCSVTGMAGAGISVTAAGGVASVVNTATTGNGGNGVEFIGTSRGSVVRSHADDNSGDGIFAGNGATVSVADSTASRNVNIGVHVNNTTAATTTVSIDGLEATRNQAGVVVNSTTAGGKSVVDATRSNLSENTVTGFQLSGLFAAGVAIASLTDSLVASNGNTGVSQFGPASPVWTLTVGGNRIVNTTGAGLVNNSGTLRTRGDNTVSGNVPDSSGVLTTLGGT
jgi:hypothetical protein